MPPYHPGQENIDIDIDMILALNYLIGMFIACNISVFRTV